MTFIAHARSLALQESHALRAYARAGRRPPPAAPVDHWGDWVRVTKHTNKTTKRTKGIAA